MLIPGVVTRRPLVQNQTAVETAHTLVFTLHKGFNNNNEREMYILIHSVMLLTIKTMFTALGKLIMTEIYVLNDSLLVFTNRTMFTILVKKKIQYQIKKKLSVQILLTTNLNAYFHQLKTKAQVNGRQALKPVHLKFNITFICIKILFHFFQHNSQGKLPLFSLKLMSRRQSNKQTED